MAEFKKMFPSFGEHITIQQPPLQVDGDSGTMKLVQKIVVDMKENIENKITEEIIAAAKEQGITDLIVLDKKAIIDAMQKQVPKEPINFTSNLTGGKDFFYECAVCGKLVSKVMEYCSSCGHALKWGDDNESLCSRD